MNEVVLFTKLLKYLKSQYFVFQTLKRFTQSYANVLILRQGKKSDLESWKMKLNKLI